MDQDKDGKEKVKDMMIPQRCVIAPNILYYDIYGRLEEKEPFREQFLLSVCEPGDLSALRLSLSFGKDMESLTLMAEGKEIKCSPGYGWTCKRTVDEDAQRIHWDLERREEAGLYYEPYLWISFSDITLRKAGIAYLEITCREGTFHEYLPIIKEQLLPRITRFSPVEATIRKGQKAVLKWETRGARKCVLNPGNMDVDTSGMMEVQPAQDTVYVLDAVGALEQDIVSKSTRVYLYEEHMENYLIAQPERYYWGSQVTIFYKAGDQSGCFDLRTDEFCSAKRLEKKMGDDLRFEITADGEVTAYKAAEKSGSLQLYPDEQQVIIRYVAAPMKKESGLSFALGWVTKGAKEIQLFVRVYSMDLNREVYGFCDEAVLLTSENEEGETVWSPVHVTGPAKYLFFLRTKNAQGERKEVVYIYEDETEVGCYDNLGK
ncbi:MAG: hypothetical protein K2I96_15715 [Lachnospiraceae bacterium]|nr:hypothetical protein [Lachnospiraceae bacterium]